MNAAELLDALAALPGVRRLAAPGDGIAASVMLNGIEVGFAEQPDARELRGAWRRRYDGGPDPLLLLADAEGDSLRALGPRSHDDPIRLVDATELLRTLERLLARTSLEAKRELSEELARLDRASVAGVQVRGLATEHLLTERLRADAARWARLAELTVGLPNEWRPLLGALGYEVDQLPHRGYLLKHEGRRVAVLHALADAAGFARLAPDGSPPEGALVEDCLREDVRWGLLASGGRFRLYDAAPAGGSATGRFLELDVPALTGEDRPLAGLLSPEYLADGGFDRLLAEARDFGVRLRRRIDTAIRHDVLPVLGRELGLWAGAEASDDERRGELEAAALTFVFRALFLLYAESAGHLPVAYEAYRPHSLTSIVREAKESGDRLGERSTSLWDRIGLLVKALRDGNPAWLVPAYNGALFADDGFEGARILEQAEVHDAALGPALVALGIDDETGSGFDFSGLDIGHLGHIYEGLLSLRLSVADRPYRYDARDDRYVAASAGAADVAAGELLWLTDEGGRKGGGVYYTPEPLVRHLVRRGVVPAFERHLEEVERLVRDDPAAAAKRLFEFRVLDPACGSAHFLVAVVDELAGLVSRFLARNPLPAVARELGDLRAGAGETYGLAIEDAALLRRLVLKRCVYGVDLSPMGAEIAKISLWLASFVPGLALSYLDHNVKVGNSLVGVADLDAVELAGDVLRQALEQGSALMLELQDVQDRTPDEVEESKAIERQLDALMAEAKAELDRWNGLTPAFHWPLEFPEVFSNGGFDAVVGNPPWEQVRTDEVGFFLHHRPGIKGLSADERMKALAELRAERPDLERRLEVELEQLERLRRYWNNNSGFASTGGFPDLYKLFCQRYELLLRDGGVLGVVLPRSAFGVQGSTDFRRWLFERTTTDRIDFLLNSGRWAFDAEPRYTVALVIAHTDAPAADHEFEVAGVAASANAFAAQIDSPGLPLQRAALGPLLEVPLLPSADAADLLTRMRSAGTPFPLGTGRWKCFAVQELNEKFDRDLWQGATEGWELWKGESFDQYDPHGAESRPCPDTEDVRAKVRKSRPGSGSLLAERVPTPTRVEAVRREVGAARVAFRDVSRATDSRTVRAALVPPRTFLTNKAPYLAFVEGGDRDRACCLALLNSLPFDWQARRFVETNVNFFILEGLRLPALDDETYAAIATAAARLSCPDGRFAAFAESTGVEVGPLEPDERDALRAGIDARVARAWGLDEADLETIFADFTLDAVPEPYRERVRGRFRELG